MSLRIRKEEYTALGDFVRVSFVRDQAVILSRFTKLNAGFLVDFTAKLEEIKVLESGLVLTEEQKAVTSKLYAEAAVLNKELNFLIRYIKEVGLSSEAVTELKKDLISNNIEGAILKIESVKQYVIAKSAELEAIGMSATFAADLEGHRVSLSERNALQNSFMNSRKQLTEANKAKYNELYGYINKIINAGKLVFDGTATRDEYTITKVVSRMRFAKSSGEIGTPQVA